MTDSQIARQIAGRLGIDIRTPQEAAETQRYNYLLQDNQCDIIFLLERSRRIGYDLFVEEDESTGQPRLFFGPSQKVRQTTYRLTYGRSLVEFQPDLTTANQVNEVTVRGWDNVNKKEIKGTATRSEIATRGVGDRGGQKAIDQSFQQKKEIVATRPIESEAEAKQLAREILERNAKEMLKGSGSTVGLPLCGQAWCWRSTGWESGSAGGISSLPRRTRSAMGVTRLDLSAAAGRSDMERDNGIVIGIVSSLKDDEGLGRVQVKFPHLDNKLSCMCRVVSPMAGKKRGTFFKPEKDDEVLVAFEHGDPRRPYVLGALWSKVDPPPPDDGNAEKNNWRQIHSRSGHVLRFDDTQGAEKIEIFDKSTKHKIVIDASGDKIQILCDRGNVEVKAPAGTVKVEATTVEMKATAEMKLEASGTLTIKGATVNIN